MTFFTETLLKSHISTLNKLVHMVDLFQGSMCTKHEISTWDTHDSRKEVRNRNINIYMQWSCARGGLFTTAAVNMTKDTFLMHLTITAGW